MEEYKEPYVTLFRAVNRALNELDLQNYGRAKEILIQGQLDAEEAFISAGEAEDPDRKRRIKIIRSET